MISPVSLNTLILPGSLLTEDIVYYWRVRYFDSYEAGSEWSETHSFKTIAGPIDGNGNGIPDAQELDVASPVDLDQNGIPDVSQINDQFKVLNTVDGSGQIGLVTTNPNDIIEFIESRTPDAYPEEGGETNKPAELPYGLLSFRLRVQNTVAAATVIAYFSDPLPDTYKWYKYDLVRGWYVDTDVAFSADRRSLTFTLIDGGKGDADGMVNGIIVDPVGAGSDGTSAVFVPVSGSAGIRRQRRGLLYRGSSRCVWLRCSESIGRQLAPAAIRCPCIDPCTIPFLTASSLYLSGDPTKASKNVSWIRMIKYAEYFS